LKIPCSPAERDLRSAPTSYGDCARFCGSGGNTLRLPDRATIASEKLCDYFLKQRVQNDKSKFLVRAGYALKNWRQLEHDIRRQILPVEAKLTHKTRYGNMFEIRGKLVGPNGVSLNIVTIWMMEHKSQETKLITLFPDKGA
jgi:hypothetical protein